MSNLLLPDVGIMNIHNLWLIAVSARKRIQYIFRVPITHFKIHILISTSSFLEPNYSSFSQIAFVYLLYVWVCVNVRQCMCVFAYLCLFIYSNLH